MQQPSLRLSGRSGGFVLIMSLLLLIVVTIMALSIFRSFGLQEKIAGNTREKQRSLQAANSTQQYAEWWLAYRSNAPVAVGQNAASSVTAACSAGANVNLAGASIVAPSICLNSLAMRGVDPTAVPWTVSGVAIGATYLPDNLGISTQCIGTCGTVDKYWASPAFYVADMGTFGRLGELYQVDAYSYGTTPSTVTVVESTVAVTCIVCQPGAL